MSVKGEITQQPKIKENIQAELSSKNIVAFATNIQFIKKHVS